VIFPSLYAEKKATSQQADQSNVLEMTRDLPYLQVNFLKVRKRRKIQLNTLILSVLFNFFQKISPYSPEAHQMKEELCRPAGLQPNLWTSKVQSGISDHQSC